MSTKVQGIRHLSEKTVNLAVKPKAEPELELPVHRTNGSAPLQDTNPVPPAGALAAEADFYNQYPWCLNVFPSLSEATRHLKDELTKLGSLEESWQQSEVITNIFLLSCTVTDAIDDYLAGTSYDFSKVSRAFPPAKPAVQGLEALMNGGGKLRSIRLFRLSQWRAAWAAAVLEFLKHCCVDGPPGRPLLLAQRDILARLLQNELPKDLLRRRLRVPAFFRSRDFAPSDCIELGRKFLHAFPDRGRPIMVMGLRTAGSLLAPLLCAFLGKHFPDTEWAAIRPGKRLTSAERAALRGAAQKHARVLIVDESIHSGTTLAKAVMLLRQFGIPDDNLVVLNPAEPAFPDWKSSRVLQSLPRINTITLEPEERYKQRLLDSPTVDLLLQEYFKARGYADARVITTPEAKRLNMEWQGRPPERVDIRLKRVFAVNLRRPNGVSELQYVLAKSVGWGWLSYHSFLAGQKLSEFIPPVLGLREGILYTQWLREAEDFIGQTQNRPAIVETIGSYVAARSRHLRLHDDPAYDLTREARHKGYSLLASSLSRAYGSRIVAAAMRPLLQRRLAHLGRQSGALTDSKMSSNEWMVAGTKLLKCDFEHHGQGKNELGMTDPVYDLAGAIFEMGLSNDESAQLIATYVSQTGDGDLEQRLFFNKLLAGLWAQNLAVLGLQDPRLWHRRNQSHELFTSSWNFLVSQTVQQCGRLCLQPDGIGWRGPLVVADIDGVLDRMVFGFPSTTAAGIKAISWFHAHGFTVAVNTARTLQEVKQYCRAYGFAGGVAEYGAVVWDGVNERTIGLVGPEALRQLQRVQDALRQIPGVFLNDDYQHSLRAFTYQDGRTVPLPGALINDLLHRLEAQLLRVHQTGLDTAVVAKDIDKGTGLQALLSLTGLSPDAALAIGDSEPDLAMFRVAGASFAPGNISCRQEAQLLGCSIAAVPYQLGLLQIARKITHPQGGRCDRCRAVEAAWPKNKDLFLSLLEAADQKSLHLLLRHGLKPSILGIFRK